jgi:two-component system, chemotaxis family, sensor kinase CheA
MDCSVLVKTIDNLASDMLFLDERGIDIPSSGKFMNHLDTIIKTAESLNAIPAVRVAKSLNYILEKMVLDTLKDRNLGFNTFEKGVTLMQKIAESFHKVGEYTGDIQPFFDDVACVSGTVYSEGDRSSAADRKEEDSQPADAKTQIQDIALVKDFIAEGLEYIDEIEINILNLEQDPGNKDTINAIFRPFHSIKGVSSFLNLEEIRNLAHNLENLLDKARNTELHVTPALIDVILDGTDALKAMIIQLKAEVENRPVEPMKIDVPVLIERIKKVESGDENFSEKKKLGEILVNEGLISLEDVNQTLEVIQTTSEKRKIGEVLIEEGKVTPKQVSQALRRQTEQTADAATMRIDTRKLDDLIDMVGELVITQSMIQQDLNQQENADKSLVRDISQFFRITTSLQRTSMSLRMVPIKQTFQRMSRLIRDLAKNAGKVANVELFGEETEIDRNMVDEIYNPLVHMVRNAVDHGLETPEERVRMGKSEKGLIALHAYHRGGNIIIEISDDGRGLSRQKIIDKAVKKGLISNTENLSDQDVFKMIFHPGLSTAEKVTDVSGRGVGMDVVKQSVEKLRGKVEIESKQGQGSTFITSFPLTLAIIDGMMVQVGHEVYIIPTISIRQALRPARESYNLVVGRGETINVMGHLLPLVRLHEVLGIEPANREPWEAIVIVVEGENRAKCLLVDNIIGKAEVVIKNLGAGLKHIKGVSGGAIMGDGRVGLILDTEGLFELGEGR